MLSGAEKREGRERSAMGGDSFRPLPPPGRPTLRLIRQTPLAPPSKKKLSPPLTRRRERQRERAREREKEAAAGEKKRGGEARPARRCCGLAGRTCTTTSVVLTCGRPAARPHALVAPHREVRGSKPVGPSAQAALC